MGRIGDFNKQDASQFWMKALRSWRHAVNHGICRGGAWMMVNFHFYVMFIIQSVWMEDMMETMMVNHGFHDSNQIYSVQNHFPSFFMFFPSFSILFFQPFSRCWPVSSSLSRWSRWAMHWRDKTPRWRMVVWWVAKSCSSWWMVSASSPKKNAMDPPAAVVMKTNPDMGVVVNNKYGGNQPVNLGYIMGWCQWYSYYY